MAGQLQTAARMLAAGRVLIGATLFAAPDLAAVPWVGDDARTAGAHVLVRALGARDAALGLGTLAAGDPSQLRRWLLASSASDAADFVATLAGPRSSARTAVLALAAAAAVSGVALAASV